MKKITAIILIMAFILSLIPINSYAIESEQEFFNYLDSISVPKSNTANKVANYLTYKEYGLIVYGSPWGDKKPTGINGKTGPQYRYLGYTLENQPYTNPYFPPDASSGNKPEDFNYIKPPGALESWKNIDDSQKEHMLYSTLSGNGATSPSFTLASIGGYEYGKLLSPSTWKSQGSIYLQHRVSSGAIWYITQTTPPMVGDTIVTGEISTPSDTYYIRKDETQVKIPVTVTARAVKSGRAEDKHIREIKATSLGQSQTASGIPTVSKTSDFVASRANYKPGTHTITLNGSVSLISIFNDTGSLNLSKTITLIVEEEGDEPYVTTTVTPNPAEKKFENKDIDVVLTVNGELHNYTKTSNIKEWVFYAREKESSTALEKKIYKKSLTASTDFKFTIPASKVTSDDFTQHYVVRARVYFNEKVNGKDYYDSPAETFVYIYKKEPEKVENPPGQELVPPIAIVKAPPKVMAGEKIVISGADSYHPLQSDSNKIVEWLFGVPGANGVQRGQYYDAWYPIERVGINRIDLVVTDNHGLRDNDWTRIHVTEPIPIPKIKFRGSLKENRKIIIDGSDSYSPELYPIDERLTVYKITDLNGKEDNIYYKGTLKGSLIKEVLIKKPGLYKVDLYVENIAGYSNTITEIFEVEEDIPPIAEFSIDNKTYRDGYDNNYAPIRIYDMSLSTDGDFIQEWIWTITYNSDNAKDSKGNPVFKKENSFSFKGNDIKILEEKTISHGGINYRINRLSLDVIEVKTNQVGYYLVELEVKEMFGQDTILDFIADKDYKRGNTENKYSYEKIIMVDNHPPTADFAP